MHAYFVDAIMVWRLQLISDYLVTKGNHLSSNFIKILSYPLCTYGHRTKLTIMLPINVVKTLEQKCCMEAIVMNMFEDQMRVYEHLIIDISEYNHISGFFTKIGLDLCIFWQFL